MVLVVSNLSCSRSSKVVFSRLSFCMEEGQTLALLGPNGTGKTTLLLCLSGRFPPLFGKVYWKGKLLFDRNPLSSYGQIVEPFFHFSRDQETIPLKRDLITRSQMNGLPYQLDEILNQMGMDLFIDKPLNQLSLGQQKKAFIIRMIISKKPLWLLDEPFIGLDRFSINLLQSVITNHLNDGGIALVSTHQSKIIEKQRVLWF